MKTDSPNTGTSSDKVSFYVSTQEAR